MAPKLHLPPAAIRRSWEEPSGECCCDNACRGNTCFRILAAAHTTGGLLAVAMISAIVEKQHQQDPEPMRRSMGLLAHPLAAFAVLPLLGTLIAKAPDFIRAIRLLGSAAFVVCLMVDLVLPSLFLASNKVDDVLPVCSLLLGFCDAAVSLALLCACENQVVKAHSVRLTEAFGVAFVVALWGESLGLAMAAAPWGQNGYFSGFTSDKCVAGSTCMRMQICGLLGVPFQLLGLVLALRLNSKKCRWRSSRSSPSQGGKSRSSGEKSKEELEEEEIVVDTESQLAELVQDPGTQVALLSTLLSGVAMLCAKEQAQVFMAPRGQTSNIPGAALRFLFGILGCGLAPRLVRAFGAFGTWMVAALTTSALLLVSPVTTGFGVDWWAATATGLLPVLFFALPCVVTARRARARGRPVSLALALTLATQQGSCVLWQAAGHVLPNGLGPWLGAVCSVWAAVLCSRAIVCDRDGQIVTASTTPSA